MIKDDPPHSFLKCLITYPQPYLTCELYLFLYEEVMQFLVPTECCSFYILKAKQNFEGAMEYFL